MKYIVSIHGYDNMDQITYSCRIRQYSDYEHDDGVLVWAQGGSFPGVGADQPDEWLCALLDHLSHLL